MAGELFDVINSLWGETENLSYEGKVSPWRLENAWITPKPLYGRPVLVNATGSPAHATLETLFIDGGYTRSLLFPFSFRSFTPMDLTSLQIVRLRNRLRSGISSTFEPLLREILRLYHSTLDHLSNHRDPVFI